MRLDLVAAAFLVGSTLAASGQAAPDRADTRGMTALSITGSTVLEGDAGLTGALFQVFAMPAPTGTVTVEYMTVDGTATVADNDYLPDGNVLVFAPGETVKNVVIQVVGDTVFEPDEDFRVQLQNPSGTGFLDIDVASATITNDDMAPPPATLSIGDATVVEGDAGTVDAVFPVTLQNQPQGQAVTVMYQTRDGGAQAGTDYAATSGTLLFPAGARGPVVQNIVVPVNGDLQVEADEVFFVDLTAPMGATITDGEGMGTITNDDTAPPPPPPPATLSIGDATVAEGDTGTVDAVFPVTLQSQPPGQAVTVMYQTRDGGAQAGTDYAATSGTLLFPAGTGGTVVQNIAVPVNGDLQVEADEIFFVDLTAPMGATIADGEGMGTITNDDATPPPPPPPPLPVVSIGDARVPEGDTGTRPVFFRITLDRPAAETVSVGFATLEGSATIRDRDFVPKTETVVFAPGEVSADVAVQIRGDTRAEGDETFPAILRYPDGVALGDAEGICTIVDDDGGGPPPPPPPPPPPTVSVADATPVTEGDAGTVDAVFELTLSAPAAGTVTVDFASEDGSATAADDDYRPVAGTATFGPGTARTTVAVPIVGDERVEDDETFALVLANPDGATLGDARGTGTILDDDEETALPTISIDDVEVVEGDAGTVDAVFTATLSAPAADPVVVVVTPSDGTATVADGDYLPIGCPAAGCILVFAPGTITATFTMQVLGDTVPEPDEDFFLDLSDPDGAQLADPRGRCVIRNDDLPAIAIGDARVSEGDDGDVGAAVFAVTLSAPAATPVTVDFATVDGSATAAGGDYRAAAGTLNFAPGEIAGELEIAIIGDGRVEGDETFTVALGDPAGATIADGEGVGTIVDDDVAPSVISLLPVPPALEGEGPLIVTVVRSGGLDAPASVTVNAAAGSAEAGEDFVARSAVVSWGAGQGGARTVDVQLIDDDLLEGDETVAISLADAIGGALAAPTARDAIILDDDTAMRLEALGEQTRDVIAGQDIELTVRARRDDGAPVRGALVRWSVDGDAELLGDAEQRSGEDGVARQTVRLGRRPGETRVTAVLVGLDSTVAFLLRAAGDLAGAFAGEDSNASNVARVLDLACATAEGSLAEGCDYLFGLDEAGRRRTIIALTPDDAANQGTAALRGPQSQLDNLLARLDALRAGIASTGTGAGNVSIAQLGVAIQGRALPLQAVIGSGPDAAAAKMLGEAEARAALDARIDEALDDAKRQARPRLAAAPATAVGDSVAAQAGGDDSGKDEDAGAAFDTSESPWGIFVNGRISIGDAPGTGREAGYDFETGGLTAGLDYRLSERLVVGGALGYLRTDTEVAGTGGAGGLDATGYTVSAYGTYYRDAFYVDGLASYGWNDYDLARVIDLAQPFKGRTRLIARASPGGEQVSLNLGGGYERTVGGATSVGGFARLGWASADIDGYRERGADPFDLTVGAQTVESLLGEVGIEVAYPWSRSWGVLQPSLRLAVLHEFGDDSRLIRARFSQDRANNELLIVTDDPDRDFVNLGLALTATLARGWAFYLQYDTDLARDDLDIGTFAGGFRTQF